jgi:hypothetical protein
MCMILAWHVTEGRKCSRQRTHPSGHAHYWINISKGCAMYFQQPKVCVTRRETQSKDDFLQCRMSPPCTKVTINPTGMTVSHRNALLCNLNPTDPYLPRKKCGALTEATMKNTVLWNVKPCSFVNMYQQLGDDRQGYEWDFYRDDGRSGSTRNIGTYCIYRTIQRRISKYSRINT